MAHVTKNLILETCAAAFSASDHAPLLGSLPGYCTFVPKCADGDAVHDLIRAVDVVGRLRYRAASRGPARALTVPWPRRASM